MPSVLERLRNGLPPTFTVERELASGGMGTVFLGRDESLDRPVAIKILRPELSTAVAVERFIGSPVPRRTEPSEHRSGSSGW